MFTYWEIRPYAVPLRTPLPIPDHTNGMRVRRGWTVGLYTHPAMPPGSLVGMGEITCWPGFGAGETIVTQAIEQLQTCPDERAAISACIHDARTLTTPQAISVLLAEMAQMRHWPCELVCGIEMALIDCLARSLHQPVWRVLRGGSDDASTMISSHDMGSPRVYVNGLAWTIDDALTHVRAGVKAIKIKVGSVPHNESRDGSDFVTHIGRMRDAVGPDVAMRVDANGAWTVSQAITMARALKPFDIGWIEQPIAPAAQVGASPSGLNPGAASDADSGADSDTDPRLRVAHDLARIAAEGGIAIAADESVRNLADVDVLIRTKAVQALVLKPMFLGGLFPTMQIAQRARVHGMGVVITHAMGTAVERWGGVHVAAALGGSETLPCGLAGGHLLHDIAQPPHVQQGAITVPGTSGLAAWEGHNGQ